MGSLINGTGDLTRHPWRLTEEIALVTQYNKIRKSMRTTANTVRRAIPREMWVQIAESIQMTTGSSRTPKAVKARAFIISSRVNHCTKSADPFDVKAVAASFLREIDRSTELPSTQPVDDSPPEPSVETPGQLTLGLPMRKQVEGIWTPLDLAKLKVDDLQTGEKFVAEASEATVGGHILFRVYIEREASRVRSES